MFSRIQTFISRHRRKFFGVAVTGVIIWGGWSYLNWRMQRSEEECVREILKKAKRHMHHKSSAQAAERQVMALVPVAAKATNDVLNTSEIVNQLKGSSKVSGMNDSEQHSKCDKEAQVSLTHEERIAKWDELKRVAIARAVAYAYVPSVLIVFIRMQLSVLGGYVFKSCGTDNLAAFLDGNDEIHSNDERQESIPIEIQEAYLSLSQFFLEGKSATEDQLNVDLFQESQKKVLALRDPKWNHHRVNGVEGKSRLNLGQPLLVKSETGDRCHSLSACLHKCDGMVTSSKFQGEIQEKGNVNGSAGNGEESTPDHKRSCSAEVFITDKCMSGGNSLVAQVMDCSEIDVLVNKQVKSPGGYVNGENNECSVGNIINKNQVPCSEGKSMILVNGSPNTCCLTDSGIQPHNLSQMAVSTEKVGESKVANSREPTEEDSGRCSGTDEVIEDELMEVKGSKSGIGALCLFLEKKVGSVVDSISLKMPYSLADVETLFWGILTAIRSNPAEDPAFNLTKYLLPPQDKILETAEEIASHLDRKNASLFLEMVSETSDLLETKEVVELVQSSVSAGLGHIMDRLANHFPMETLCIEKRVGPPYGGERQVQQKETIPLAKLIPIITRVAFEEGTPWVSQLLEMSNLKDFGANVYEAFTH